MPKRSFLDLPPEIRSLVYCYLLKGKGIVLIRQNPSEDRAHRKVRPIVTKCQPQVEVAILSANKLIHKEAMPILYSQYTFSAADPALMKTFIQRRGLTVQHLKHISVDYTSILDFRTNFRAMISALKAAECLKILELAQPLYNPVPTWTPLFTSTTEILDELLPLLEALHRARPHKTGEARAASDLLSVRIKRIDHQHWELRSDEADELEKGMKALLDDTLIS